MAESWTARQMEPGKDTVRTMATHYGYTPSVLKEVIRKAGTKLVREDGFKGTLVMTKSTDVRASSIGRTRNVIVWSDGQAIDPATTLLTRASIKAVSKWAFVKMYGDA